MMMGNKVKKSVKTVLHKEGLARKEFFKNFMDTYEVNKIDTKNKDSAYMKWVNNTIAIASISNASI